MNHIDPTSSLHFLIRNKLHRNGEVHRGSMNHFFILVFTLLFKRSAHSAVPTLVAWRFGGNEGLEGLERNRDW